MLEIVGWYNIFFLKKIFLMQSKLYAFIKKQALFWSWFPPVTEIIFN